MYKKYFLIILYKNLNIYKEILDNLLPNFDQFIRKNNSQKNVNKMLKIVKLC